MLFFYLVIIIELINKSFQKSIDKVDPLIIKINTAKLENISMTLIFNETVNNRNQARIKLFKSSQIFKEFSTSKTQDKNNEKKIEFIIEPDYFINKYGKYSLICILNNIAISFGSNTIFIYNNDLILKNPINKYLLTENTSDIKTITYEFQSEIVSDEINKIIYYKNSNINTKYLLSDNNYTLKEGNKLILKFSASSEVASYTFDIYPEYDKNISNSQIHRFYLHFHNYLLKNDAIYLNKQKTSNIVSFKTLLKQNYNLSPFTITDSGRNINSDSFSCNKSGDYYLCECTISFGIKNTPGKINIIYQNNQIRELFIILYTSYMEKCYDKDDNENLEISMEWTEEMEYDHFLYFIDISPKILTPTYLGKTSSIISYKYRTSTLPLSSGIFTLISSIPSLNYTDYNAVDDKNLYIYIYPSTQLINKMTSYIYSHNNTKQIVNLTFNTNNDDEEAKVLDEIILRKDDNTEIKVSKTERQCIVTGNSFICDLKDIIFNYGNDKNGKYSIYYKSVCGKELMIEERFVILQKGYSLLSISPLWIDKANVNGTQLTLEYDSNMENKNLAISLYITKNILYGLPYSPISIKNNYVIISLNNLDIGLYHVRTSITGEITFDEDNLSFKVSEQILNFYFNHHYFVLNNNGEINKLIIKVNDNSGTFGCNIIEDSSKQSLIHNNCSIFEYLIIKTGTIKFSYYDKDNYIIPINDYITVVQYYSQLFSFISLRNCYYFNFEISTNILDSYKNKFKLYLFLKSTDNINTFYLVENTENNHVIVIKNENLINKNYYLYVSENYYDKDVYLYRTDNYIQFTSINVPPYIIEPNITIVFSDVKCDLSQSKFIITKDEDNTIQRNLINCKYNSYSKQLSCNISGMFYVTNRYKKYYYLINKKKISNINNASDYYLTFASKKLNDASFDVKHTSNGNLYTITFENKEKDFYFPLLSNLSIYKYISGKNESTTFNRNDNNFEINDDNGEVKLKINLELNSILYINRFTRKTDYWETNINIQTFYHYFNYIINNKLFDVYPTVCAYNNINTKEFPITIKYENDNSSEIYNKYKNVKDCSQNSNENKKCIDVTTGNFELNKAQKYNISIGDGEIYENFTIDFIYYELTDESKICKTKDNNMDNLILDIYFPDISLVNKLNLDSDISIINEINTYNKKSYILNGNEVDLQEAIIDISIDDKMFYDSFTLQELGLNIKPKYNINLNNNEKVIYLLPNNGNNQKVRISLSSENNENFNINDDITGFKIKNGSFQYNLGKENINENSINLIFKEMNSNINYKLYYIDICGKDIETGVDILFNTFTIKRNYFVLNNNLDMDKQNLTIEGPHLDSMNIMVYKDNSYYGNMNYDSKYYIELDKYSKGDHTFIVNNNGDESPIDGVVYVRDNLGDLFTINENVIPSCLFWNEDKNTLSSLSYTIKSNEEIINDIQIFKSKFTINKSSFDDLIITDSNSKQESFKLEYSNTIRNNIKINQELYIYLTEKDYTNQPIYVFKYKYTNIELNLEFENVIYTDADYISFNMNCKINNIQPFYLLSLNNNEYKISCEERENNFDNSNKIYKCYLSANCKENNELLKFGNEIFEYGYYDIKYTKLYTITNKKVFLSHEISDIEFEIKKDDDIIPEQNTTVTITMGKKIFYSPNTESVKYGILSIPESLYDSNFNNIFEVKNNNLDKNYITCSINIAKGNKYGIKQICRNSCYYCRHSDCNTLNANYNIFSTTPFVKFKFDKHYIALNNSTDDSNIAHDSLVIEKSGEDTDQIDYIIYNHTNKNNRSEEKIVQATGNYYIINNIETGKYTFKYHVIGGKNLTMQNEVVLVVDYDYEIFDYTELTKGCLYYKEKKGILVSITKNPDYIFKDDVVESVMEIYLNDYEFPYEKENGFQIISENIPNFNYKGNTFILKLRERDAEKRFTFTTISKNVEITTFDLNSNDGFFYKDNIVLKNQYCGLDNIYILSESNKNEPYSLLKCDYYNRISYCDAIYYSFTLTKSDYFGIYIGNQRTGKKPSYYFNTELIQLIYNSINGSNFIVNYNEPTIIITSSNFYLSLIKEIKIDNDYISKDNFLKISNDLITYNFYKNYGIDNYLKELVRIDHDLDRNITIKNKEVNLTIEKKECPEFYVNYNGLCLSCLQIASSPDQDEKKIWYQNGVCVTECSGVYSIYDTEHFYCYNCSEKTIGLNNVAYCGCLVGTVKSDLDNICYLPEDDRIKRILLTRPNLQCYGKDGKTHNYCHNDNTEICELKSNSGYSFPFCHCKSGYNGKYCEFEVNKTDLNGNMDNILNGNKNNKINEGSPSVIAKIRGIIFFLEKDDTNEYVESINKNQIELYITSTINCIDSAKNNNSTFNQIYDVIELAIYFLYYNIKI